MGFGQQLSQERKTRNLSTEALAKACGLSRSYITLIESGKRMPSTKNIPTIAEALQLGTHVVLNWYLTDMTSRLTKSVNVHALKKRNS